MGQIKSITETFRLISSVSVSATSVFVSSVTAIKYKDNISYQFNWTGNPVGGFSVEGSLDYAPGTQQGDHPLNEGSWNAYTLSPLVTTATGSTYLLEMIQLSTPYLRVVYTNTSGSGVISGFFFAKAMT